MRKFQGKKGDTEPGEFPKQRKHSYRCFFRSLTAFTANGREMIRVLEG